MFWIILGLNISAPFGFECRPETDECDNIFCAYESKHDMRQKLLLTWMKIFYNLFGA